MQQILTKRNFAEAVIGTGMREGIKDQNGKRKKREKKQIEKKIEKQITSSRENYVKYERKKNHLISKS